ncbi:hypothetical protein [Lacinutrix sp. Hel_I_90]|uniref:hypothetical protein n=1 Tax=Lacinutrix sp. Hel_I_90 TaxID=1249999 RepID=UPI0005CA813D|nr:hypothetical protein [Lacinutrix sp. Hel_I_90]
MEDINTIYYNTFGIAFQWKRCTAKDFRKIQIVFRNTGLFLTQKELIQFSKHIENTLNSSRLCHDCKKKKCSKLLLLEAPNPQTSFSMTYKELKDIQDLVKGTLFHLELERLLKN